ncbi:MAG: DUF2510 domain-containing protein, partial [Methanobacteriota archaeon]
MSDATTKQETAQAPAGWWPDVNQPGWERYWNGTSWEDATRRTPVVPEPHRETFVKPKRSIWPWVAGGSAVGIFLIGAVVIFVIILIAIIASAASGTSQKVGLSDKDKPAAVEEVEPAKEEEPVKEPEPVVPVAEAGTLANPHPAGYVLSIENLVLHKDQYTVSARMLDGNAFPALLAANQFNEPAPAGMKYVLMEYTITGLAVDKPIMPGVEAYNW